MTWHFGERLRASGTRFVHLGTLSKKPRYYQRLLRRKEHSSAPLFAIARCGDTLAMQD